MSMAVAPDAAGTIDLDVFACPLDGLRLIEASAGTGKTWNLCGLYLRLLLEKGLDAPQILVVTFTNAATAELRERIRSRIVDVLAYLQRGANAADPFVARLVAAVENNAGGDRPKMRMRLEAALHTFDEAAVFTIHGFCPVSYTHLDVYKRQAQPSGDASSWPAPTAGESAPTSTSPTSRNGYGRRSANWWTSRTSRPSRRPCWRGGCSRCLAIVASPTIIRVSPATCATPTR